MRAAVKAMNPILFSGFLRFCLTRERNVSHELSVFFLVCSWRLFAVEIDRLGPHIRVERRGLHPRRHGQPGENILEKKRKKQNNFFVLGLNSRSRSVISGMNLLLLALVVACGAVDIVSIVADLETAPANPHPVGAFVELAGAVYLTARGPLGEELYRHTPAGGMVRNLFCFVQSRPSPTMNVRSSCSTS
ncbi:MAG: hypothetical protein IV100_30730 [Myxococcales bacterium]|nr:hypothetical protein [Myxococcales bacterium]